MTDLAETIARVKGVLKMPPSLPGFDLVARADLTRLLNEAEAWLRARDAALEEAARIAEGKFYLSDGFEQWKAGESIASSIRKLRSKP